MPDPEQEHPGSALGLVQHPLFLCSRVLRPGHGSAWSEKKVQGSPPRCYGPPKRPVKSPALGWAGHNTGEKPPLFSHWRFAEGSLPSVDGCGGWKPASPPAPGARCPPLPRGRGSEGLHAGVDERRCPRCCQRCHRTPPLLPAISTELAARKPRLYF